MNRTGISRNLNHRCRLCLPVRQTGPPRRVPPWRRRLGGVRLFAVTVALLAASGVLSLWRPVAPASSSPVLNWAKRSPATHLPALVSALLAYDAATGNVVLFGGQDNSNGSIFSDTWVCGSSEIRMK
jgi:hypothetical protein